MLGGVGGRGDRAGGGDVGRDFGALTGVAGLNPPNYSERESLSPLPGCRH